MDNINDFLLCWAFIATCGIGYFQHKANKHRVRARELAFMVCEVVTGAVKPHFDGKMYRVETDDCVMRFEKREKNNV